MAKLAIRSLPADHPDSARLLAAYFEELSLRLGEFDPSRGGAAPEEMTPPRGAFLVLYEDSRPIACGGIKPFDPEVAEIKRMFVAPEARGKGHGRRLLATLEEAASAMAYRRIVLDTAAPLREAAALYTSSGYRTIKPYNENPYAACWFEKDLAG